jgi:acetylornithine/succinyldiaminopimelate/putrescine aminotransferase
MSAGDSNDALRAAFLRHVCQTSAAPLGLVVDSADGAWIRDTHGRRYLDLLAGIGVAATGHRHPAVMRAIEEQSRRYLHTMVYGEHIQAPQVALAQRLAELLPPPLSVSYFTNSGAEAVEGALKTARKATGRSGLVAFGGSFHGDTFGALSVGASTVFRRPFEPLLPGVQFLPFDRVDLLDLVDERVAAVIVEPVQAEAGVRIPGPEFLPALRQRTRETGTLLIFDEVITGLGRCGRLWASEHWGVVPDLLVLAKALGGGLPLGAFAGPPEIMATLSHDPPLAHVTTFGGHPLSCAAGLASLEVIAGERLWERSAALGREFDSRLRGRVGLGALAAVRTLGLLIGLEFATVELARAFVEGCLARGLLVGWTLHAERVVRLAPPLVLSDEEAETALGTIALVLEKIAAQP